MAPLIALVVVTAVARLAGALRLAKGRFTTLPDALSAGIAAMFLITGGAQFIGLREELIKMIPPAFGDPGFWVTFTGVAEIAGGIGILIPSLRRAAAIGCLLLPDHAFP